ncbi:MAG: hypothetical protein Q4F97_11745 [Bacteroidales bacterium]|nr:hypothetical protein [Bacteroidales bacterium]
MENSILDSYRILSGKCLNFLLDGNYCLLENGYPYECEQYVEFDKEKILFNGDYYDELFFMPVKKSNPSDFNNQFILIDYSFNPTSFNENERYSGYLRIIPIRDHLEVFNVQ